MGPRTRRPSEGGERPPLVPGARLAAPGARAGALGEPVGLEGEGACRRPARGLARRGWSGGRLGLSLMVFSAILVAVCGDYYRTLGVSRRADTEDIKRAHRDLVKKHHPDKSKSSDTSKKFLEVQRAYEVLSDPEKRKLYDQYGRDPDDPEVAQAQAMQNDGRQRFRSYDPMDAFFHRSKKQQYFVPSKTQTLTLDNYDALVTHGDQVWIIQVWREFNCEKCIQVSDAWEEAARQMSGVVNFGRINFDRQGALLHRYRIRQLPTFYAISNRREVKFFEYNRQVTTDSLVDFASKVVPDSNVMYLKTATAADKFLKSEPDKVHVILFQEEWAAFASVSEIASLKKSMVFAFAPRWAPHGLGSLYGQFKERTVVVVQDGGKFVAKSGIQSRKNLVRFLLRNKHHRVPRITVDNYAELCLGWGGPSEGLHFIPPDKNSSTVCILSLRKNAKPKDRPEVQVMMDMPADYWDKAQFGWVDATDQPRLWNYLLQRAPKHKDRSFVLAAVDWVEGVTNVFEISNYKDFEGNVKRWLESIARSDEWLLEKDPGGGQVPGLQVQSTSFEKLSVQMEGALGNAVSTGKEIGWIRVIVLSICLFAAFQVLSKLMHAGEPSPSEARQQRRQQQQQQEAREEQRRRQDAARAQQARDEERARQEQSAREQYARQQRENNGARANGEGMRHRQSTQQQQQAQAEASAKQAEAKKNLEVRLQECSVRELREFAEKHSIIIADCSEKREIVAKIMMAMR